MRSSYADPFYTAFAREAIDMWKQDEWEGCYHECVDCFCVRAKPADAPCTDVASSSP